VFRRRMIDKDRGFVNYFWKAIPEKVEVPEAAEEPEIRFDGKVAVVTGAAIPLTLDGQPLAMNQTFAIAAGSTVTFGTIAGRGVRSYLCLRGGIAVPEYLGSKSTFTLGQFGGHAGRAQRGSQYDALTGPYYVGLDRHAIETNAPPTEGDERRRTSGLGSQQDRLEADREGAGLKPAAGHKAAELMVAIHADPQRKLHNVDALGSVCGATEEKTRDAGTERTTNVEVLGDPTDGNTRLVLPRGYGLGGRAPLIRELRVDAYRHIGSGYRQQRYCVVHIPACLAPRCRFDAAVDRSSLLSSRGTARGQTRKRDNDPSCHDRHRNPYPPRY